MLFNGNFYSALSSSFWIIPREGTEALLVIIMLCSALQESGRENKISVIYANGIAAILAGLALAIGCVWLHTIFTGRNRELSEAFASLIAMAMLLYVNFEIFSRNNMLKGMGMLSLGFMAFISVFREIAETILFYYALFQGGLSQQFGTLTGLVLGIVLLAFLLWLYRKATDKWKMANKLIFNLTPICIFVLAIMCIGNAINAFQEARWLNFTPVNGMFNSNFLHAQASEQYVISLTIFFATTGLLFLKQFYKSLYYLCSALFKVSRQSNPTSPVDKKGA